MRKELRGGERGIRRRSCRATQDQNTLHYIISCYTTIHLARCRQRKILRYTVPKQKGDLPSFFLPYPSLFFPSISSLLFSSFLFSSTFLLQLFLLSSLLFSSIYLYLLNDDKGYPTIQYKHEKTILTQVIYPQSCSWSVPVITVKISRINGNTSHNTIANRP